MGKLRLLCTFEGLGVDLAQGGPGRGSELLIGGGELLQERGHGWACVRPEMGKSTDGVKQDGAVCGIKIGTEGRDYVRCGVRWEGLFFLNCSENTEHIYRRRGDLRIGVPNVRQHRGLSEECVCLQATE